MKTLKIVVVAFTAIIMATTSSCSKDDLCIVASGNVITKELNMAVFSGIEAKGNDNVNIVQGDVQKVLVTGHSNIVNRIETDVKNGIWEIKLENGCYTGDTELNIDIVVRDMNKIKLEGSGNIEVGDFINQLDMEVEAVGSGNIVMQGNTGTENLFIDIEGSGDISIMNDFSDLITLDIDIDGSGNYNGFNNITDKCTINSTGSGSSNVYVRDLLDVKITGSGNVNYKGNPQINADITGSGQIINRN